VQARQCNFVKGGTQVGQEVQFAQLHESSFLEHAGEEQRVERQEQGDPAAGVIKELSDTGAQRTDVVEQVSSCLVADMLDCLTWMHT